jgi:hypothetical protein
VLDVVRPPIRVAIRCTLPAAGDMIDAGQIQLLKKLMQ